MAHATPPVLLSQECYATFSGNRSCWKACWESCFPPVASAGSCGHPPLQRPRRTLDYAFHPQSVSMAQLSAPAGFSAFDGILLQSAISTQVLAAVLTVLGLLIWGAWLRRRRPAANLPPGPTGLPLVGSLHLLGALPHQSLAKLAKKYGPLMAIRLGQAQFIVASSPQTAKEFLKTQDANFCSRPPGGRAKSCLDQGNSEVWRQQRKMFMMGLTGSKRLEATRHLRQDEMAQLLRVLPCNCEFSLRKHLRVFFTNIMSRTVVNRSFSAHSLSGSHELPLPTKRVQEIQAFRGIIGAIVKGMGSFYPADFIPAVRWVLDFQGLDNHFRETSKRMDAFAMQIIADHQARRAHGPVAEDETDMVHIVLDEAENYNANAGISRPLITMANIKGIIWDGFVGGTDTSLFSCEWIMSEVVINPSIQAAAQAELDREVGRQRRVQEADLPNLRYIQAVVKEGLRLHPIAPLLAVHHSLHASKAFGYDIPANTRLLVNVWAISRDPSVWSDPLQFQPERWLGQDKAELGRVAAQCEYLPFGAGRRMCPGMALGIVMLEHCVASLVQAFEWSVSADPGNAEVTNMGSPRALPLLVTATPRLSSQVMDN